MTQKEKAAGVLPAPDAAIQKSDRVIIVGNLGRVNGARQGASMLQSMQMVGLAPAKMLDLVPDGKLRRYRVQGDKAGSANGWYVLHDHPVMAGALLNFARSARATTGRLPQLNATATACPVAWCSVAPVA